MGAKLLTFEEAIQWSRGVIWLEMREMNSGALPVTYYLEHAPFVRFKCDAFPATFEVRKEYYGKTWRCWSDRPDWPRDWED